MNTEVIHVSFDVVSMFPSISKDIGLEQCKIHLDKRIYTLYLALHAYWKH